MRPFAPHVTSSLRSLIAVAACLTGFGCGGPSQDLSRPQELARERLQPDDCAVALAAYRQRLQLPPHAGVVVSNRDTQVISSAEQDQLAAAFALECQTLVGHARRAILRCWIDSTDATLFRGCNNRF